MNDDELMREALRQAQLGLGRTSPNPPVGSVIATAEHGLIARGYHHRAGEPHAEAMALREAGEAARGATLYCTLEPCCHHGRTPPCAQAIIDAGVARVVYAATDPDIRCAGEGEAALRAAGLDVTAGLLAGEVAELYEPYFKHKQTGQPFVTLKLAMTLDGKVATRTGDSRWITGEPARALVHRWRDETDAVLVGVGTVLADDPQLTARGPKLDDREPMRVVVDTQARTPVTAQVLATAGHCLIAVGPDAPAERVSALRDAGAEVVDREVASDGKLSLQALLAHLGQRNIMSVLCEGGPRLAAGLVRDGLVDKYRLFYAPKLVGAEGLPAFGPLGLQQMSEAVGLELRAVERVGEDLLVTAYPTARRS